MPFRALSYSRTASVLASYFMLGWFAPEVLEGQPLEEVPLTEFVEVRLVEVDVSVEDKNGQPVDGLQPGDFEIFEDGQRVEIAAFTATAPRTGKVGRKRGTVSSDPAPAVGDPMRLVVFVDELHLDPLRRSRVLQEFRKAVRELPKDGIEMMVLRFDGQTRVVQPMTADRDLVLSTLEKEALTQRIPMMNSKRETERVLAYLENLQYQNTEGTRGFGDVCTQNGNIARKHAQQMHTLALQSLAGLARALGALSRIDGRKALVHVSEGIPMMPGTKVYGFAAELCDGTGAAEGLENVRDTWQFESGKNTRWNPRMAPMELAEFETTRHWEELTALANAKRVSFFPVDATGVGAGRRSQSEGTRISLRTESTAKADMRETLAHLARDTGGRAIFNRNDLRGVLGDVSRDIAQPYRLAYVPSTPGDGKTHKIEVRVTRPEVQIRHRRSYLGQSRAQRMTDAVVATLLQPSGENPLRARLRLTAANTSETKARTQLVKLSIELPLSELTLLDGELESRGQFSVFVGAKTEGDRITPVRTRVFPVRVATGEVDQYYTYEVEIELPRGQATVAAVLQDDLSGGVSLLRRDVDVPIS